MAKEPRERRYSVYRAKDDMPIVIYGTSQQCADALGIKVKSFYGQVLRSKDENAGHSKYVVYKDKVEDLEE